LTREESLANDQFISFSLLNMQLLMIVNKL